MSSLYEYLGLTMDLAVAAYLVHLHRKDCQTINRIKQAPLLDVGPELVSLLDEQPNQTLPYAVIRGRISPINETIETSNGSKGVVKIITVHEVSGKFGVSWESEGVPPLNETRNSVPFALKPISVSAEDSSRPSLSVEVKNPFDSAWESLLLPCSYSFIPKNTSIKSAVMGGLGNTKAFGIRRSEKFLPVDAVITGIGQVMKDPKNSGRLCITETSDGGSHCPYILTSLTFEDFLSKLEVKKQFQRMVIAGTLSIGVIIIFRKLYWKWKRYKMGLMRETILRERRSKNLDDLCRCQTCLVCLMNPREVILMNCGHVAICADCLMKLRTCPICRETISMTRKAYIA